MLIFRKLNLRYIRMEMHVVVAEVRLKNAPLVSQKWKIILKCDSKWQSNYAKIQKCVVLVENNSLPLFSSRNGLKMHHCHQKLLKNTICHHRKRYKKVSSLWKITKAAHVLTKSASSPHFWRWFTKPQSVNSLEL